MAGVEEQRTKVEITAPTVAQILLAVYLTLSFLFFLYKLLLLTSINASQRMFTHSSRNLSVKSTVRYWSTSNVSGSGSVTVTPMAAFLMYFLCFSLLQLYTSFIILSVTLIIDDIIYVKVGQNLKSKYRGNCKTNEMAVRYAALSACRKVHVCHCNSLGGATWR